MKPFYKFKLSWFEKAIFKYILSYLLVFLVGRLIFLGYNYSDIENESFFQILLVFIKGLRMDLSALSYLSPVVLLLLFSYQISQKAWIIKVLKVFLSFTFFLFFVIVIAELPIYDEWMTKLNTKAVSYLRNMNEVMRTATWGQIVAMLLVVPLLTFSLSFVLHRLIKADLIQKVSLWRNLSVLAFALALGFLGARGGFYQIPLSASGVFFSNNRTLNFATVNSIWSLGYSYYKESKYDDSKKFKYYSEAKMNTILKDFKQDSDSITSILKTKNPNIILVLFESWSADLVDSLDQTYQMMPNWRSIRKESLNFNQCYAAGRHSEEGMLAVFAGFPSLANSYLMGFTEKNAKLPTLTKKLAERNYQQSFFFGGDLGYANIKSFFYQNPFYKIMDEMDFPTQYNKGKLGYHDEALYAEMFKETKQSKEPFFIGGFTSSTHSPYDVPLDEFKDYTPQENEYMNSAYYADSCLGQFYKQCKQEEWFDNTLLVFVSDHSHPTPIKRDYCSPGSTRIVYMLAGGAIKDEYKGQEFDKIVSQIDIPSTLLSQMGYDTKDFIYSRNVLDSLYQPFAYFSFKTCQGSITEQGFANYSLSNDKINSSDIGASTDSLVSISKALLQKSYTQFRDL